LRMPGVCATCTKPANRRCGRCKSMHYCSAACQSDHWKTHKPDCTPAVIPGCSHYKRKCALVSPCCDRVFSCRFCHDLEMHENEPNPEKSHRLDRHAVTHVVCKKCGRKQRASPFCGGDLEGLRVPSLSSTSSSDSASSSPSLLTSASGAATPGSDLLSSSLSAASSATDGKGCGETFAAYCCLICNLFDEEGLTKKAFHCEDCGICRVGGRDAFFHCPRCNACYAKALQTNHSCVEQSLQRNCPVCQEDMFSSRIGAQVLLCGHTMHSTCLQSFQEAGQYKCPTCNRTILSAHRAQTLWAQMKTEVMLTPMPAEYASTMVSVLCNDCNQKSNVNFHVIGHECAHCHSFNTVRG